MWYHQPTETFQEQMQFFQMNVPFMAVIQIRTAFYLLNADCVLPGKLTVHSILFLEKLYAVCISIFIFHVH